MSHKDWTLLEGESEQVATAVTMKTIKEILEEQGQAHLLAPQPAADPAPVPRQQAPSPAGPQTPPRAAAPVQPRRPAPRPERAPEYAPVRTAEPAPEPERRGLVARLFKRG
ncbi:hypothetical protein [Sagittula sp. S175]|uniref:hypothetical protein n=1 Tax=Sagittula sp. S175 TaxID=3415129 RepID=UPI003C7D1792